MSFTRWFRVSQFFTAFVGIGLGVFLLYYFVTTDVLANYGYKSKAWAVGGALALIGGCSIWLIARLRDALENTLAGTSYIVLRGTMEQSFRRRKHAEARIAELLAEGTPASALKLTKVTTTITSDEKVETRTEDLQIRDN